MEKRKIMFIIIAFWKKKIAYVQIHMYPFKK